MVDPITTGSAMRPWPDELAPKKGSASSKEPFLEWWERVQAHFPHIPKDVGEQWLYENWASTSPFGYLIFQPYRFDLVEWPSGDLIHIRERIWDWEIGSQKAKADGNRLIENLEESNYRTARYMVDQKEFPRPIIVLDNRDGHLRKGIAPVPESEDLPASYLLIEGHRRFQMGLYLLETGDLSTRVQVWLMTPDDPNAGSLPTP